MKNFLTFFLVFLSLSSFAKLTIFNAQNALDLVANDEIVLTRILTKSNTSSVVNIDAEQVGSNQFEVVVTSKKSKTTCNTIVDVKAVISSVAIPGGGKISANSLKITNVSKSVCLR